MIPGFPLDGGRVLRSILWHFTDNLRRATHIASRIGSGFGLVLVGLGIFAVIGGNLGGVWSILIGLFIRHASKQGYQQVLIRQSLEGEPVRRFMNDQPVTVDPNKTVQELVDDYIYRYHYKLFPVVENDHLVGCVTLRQVREIPRDEWSQTPVGQIASDCDARNTVSADMDAMHALGRMNQSQVSRFMVVEEDRLVGIVALRDLLKFLSLKMELEDRSGLTGPGGMLPRRRQLDLPAEESSSPTGR
jgi:CBS domain-containing protein